MSNSFYGQLVFTFGRSSFYCCSCTLAVEMISSKLTIYATKKTTQLLSGWKVLQDEKCWQRLRSILMHDCNGVFFCVGQIKLNNEKKCLKGKIAEVRD